MAIGAAETVPYPSFSLTGAVGRTDDATQSLTKPNIAATFLDHFKALRSKLSAS